MTVKKIINRNEMLDMILNLLMSFEVPLFKSKLEEINPNKIDMDFISKLYDQYNWEDWMKKSFQDELIYKKYVLLDSTGNLIITDLGKDFKRNGGYAEIDETEKQEKTIRTKTIESFKYGKWGFFLSIIAIILSIIALILKE